MIIFLINYFGEDHSFRNIKFVYSEIMVFKIVVILSNTIKIGLNVTIYYGFYKLLTGCSSLLFTLLRHRCSAPSGKDTLL